MSLIRIQKRHAVKKKKESDTRSASLKNSNTRTLRQKTERLTRTCTVEFVSFAPWGEGPPFPRVTGSRIKFMIGEEF